MMTVRERVADRLIDVVSSELNPRHYHTDKCTLR